MKGCVYFAIGAFKLRKCRERESSKHSERGMERKKGIGARNRDGMAIEEHEVLMMDGTEREA